MLASEPVKPLLTPVNTRCHWLPLTRLRARAMQGAREMCRGHWDSLSLLLWVWGQLRREIAGAIAAQSRLQGAWPGPTWQLLSCVQTCLQSFQPRLHSPQSKSPAWQLPPFAQADCVLLGVPCTKHHAQLLPCRFVAGVPHSICCRGRGGLEVWGLLLHLGPPEQTVLVV